MVEIKICSNEKQPEVKTIVEENCQNTEKKDATYFLFRMTMIVITSILIFSVFYLITNGFEDKTNSQNRINDGKDFSNLRFVSRADWGAYAPTKEPSDLQLPIPYVIIHHTATANCTSLIECINRCKSIQKDHIEIREWYDIGYNFLIGTDGNIYEGRGFKKQGAHTYGFNNKSLGIAFIGMYQKHLPSQAMIHSVKSLMQRAVDVKALRDDYKVYPAAQLAATTSPGEKLIEEIKTWNHWEQGPPHDF